MPYRLSARTELKQLRDVAYAFSEERYADLESAATSVRCNDVYRSIVDLGDVSLAT